MNLIYGGENVLKEENVKMRRMLDRISIVLN